MDESEAEDGDGHLYPEGWTGRLFRDHERRHACGGETGDGSQRSFGTREFGIWVVEKRSIPDIRVHRRADRAVSGDRTTVGGG
ncbi:hypothetical protein [Halosimplex halobium]|uniref:hypothetical protein n=1 Tax=Halosimplex halobium TaxID=3396618 RepID=UPI003F564BE1